jgi:hypothetical protein
VTVTHTEEPASLEEAYEKRHKLRCDLNRIEARLGDRAYKDRTPHEEYYAWRVKAVWARANVLEELWFIKDWIADNTGRSD